jgi:hypothetical protein
MKHPSVNDRHFPDTFLGFALATGDADRRDTLVNIDLRRIGSLLLADNSFISPD